MSPRFWRKATSHPETDHARAHDLAALSLDEQLESVDAAWLEGHLARCADCAAVAAAYEADQLALRTLSDAIPEPPRDLWARTAAALDAVRVASPRLAARQGRVGGSRRASLAPLAALAVVAIVVGASLLNEAGVAGPSGTAGAGPTPIAMLAANVSVLHRAQDGSIELQTRRVDEVCPMAAASCAVEPSFDVARVSGIGATGSVDGIISPTGERMTIVQRGLEGSDGVFVVRVRLAGPIASPVSSPGGGGPSATPGSTLASTPQPTPGETSSALPTEPVPTTDPSPSAGPGESPPESLMPTAAATSTPDASVEPDVSAEPTSSPEATTSAEPTATPKPTPESTDGPTSAPASPPPDVAVTPSPDGAIEIASDVVVVGNTAAFSPDGNRFAFTARPADGSIGPDVYVWDTGDTLARAVTSDHRSVFAGWSGDQLLVSRVEDTVPQTVAVVAGTDKGRAIGPADAWLPTIAPSGDQAAWWDGAVELAEDGVTWVPADGSLVMGAWPGGDGARQVLATGPLRDWQVRWDDGDTVLAVWTAGDRPGDAGQLSLYAVDPDSGRAKLGSPILEDAPAFDGFSIEDGRIAWSAPGLDGKRSVQVLAWDGLTIGRLELPAEGGTSVVR